MVSSSNSSTTSSARATKKTSAAKKIEQSAIPPKDQPQAATNVAAMDAQAMEAAAVPDEVSLELRKKELVDLVVARCDVKKRDAKPAVEAALAVLGEALRNGRELNLQPLGKIKIKRTKNVGNAQVSTLHLRQNSAATIDASAPIAPPEKES